ncbi:hypothetical protein ACLD19_22275, partial [Salmonella sp. 741265085_HSA]|uniref:hypothetical protein n=1 Tax=Salmonella sp. 741265085_HSA TaxID=3389063 RepID=UPI00397F219E
CSFSRSQYLHHTSAITAVSTAEPEVSSLFSTSTPDTKPAQGPESTGSPEVLNVLSVPLPRELTHFM